MGIYSASEHEPSVDSGLGIGISVKVELNAALPLQRNGMTWYSSGILFLFGTHVVELASALVQKGSHHVFHLYLKGVTKSF